MLMIISAVSISHLEKLSIQIHIFLSDRIFRMYSTIISCELTCLSRNVTAVYAISKIIVITLLMLDDISPVTSLLFLYTVL